MEKPPTILSLQQAQDKKRLIGYFRERGREALSDLQREIGARQFKELVKGVNEAIKSSAKLVSQSLEHTARINKWDPEERLKAILTSTYSSYIARLELRNEIWPYEYMDFSR